MKKIAEQQGFSFTGFIVIAAILVTVAIFSMKLVPSYLENGKIQKAMEAIIADPYMQNASVNEIRMAFYKRAVTMDNVTSVSENDIEVFKDDGKISMSASYKVKVPLAGNVSLLLEFHPSAPK